jgi:hypothetical protein
MSSNVLGAVVGGAVGFLVGGPAGALIGAGIGLAGSALVGGLGVGYDGPRLSDLSIQTSTYGADIPRVYSTIVVSGNVLWLENNKLRERVRKVSSGGKGGGGSSATKEYTYFATFHLGLCEGPVAGIRRIWCSDKLLYDAGSDDLETIIASNQVARKWTFCKGSDDQLPTARYEADVGVGNATGHRGLCYIEFRDFELTDYGNTLEGAQFRVELVVPEVREAPVYMFDRPYSGAIVYSDDAIFMTAVEGSSYFFDDGETEWFVGSAVYSTYNHSGQIISVESRSARVPRAGSNSIASHRIGVLRGTKNGVFVINSYRVVAGAISGQLPIDFSLASVTVADCHAFLSSSNTAFLPENDDRLFIFSQNGAISEAAVPGIETGAMRLQESADGRVFFFARALSGFVMYFGEIDFAGQVLWSQSMGQSGDGWDRRNFCVSGDRLLVHQSYALRLYEIRGASVSPLAALQTSDVESGNVDCFAQFFAITESGRVYQLTDRGGAGYEYLADIIEREAELSGLLSAGDVDVAALTQEVKGYRVTGGSIRSALEPLAVAYQFDIVPSGYKLKAVSRGQASVLTVPYADLGATASDTPSDVFKLSREMDSQLPAKTVVKYLDAAREYDIGEQAATRINTEAVNEVESELALVLGADEAAGIAEVLQSRAWLERTDVSFTLPQTYLALESCDVITVQTPDADYELLCSEMEYTQDGRIEVKAKPNAAAVYTPNASGGQGVIPGGNIGIAGPTVFVPLDIPVVDETYQNQLGFVGVMTGYTDGWPGGVLYRSGDSGQTWVDIEAWNTKCTIGSASGTLAAHDGYLIDQTELPVLLISGDLESVTRDQMLSGSNYAAYGVDGRWEIVRFQDAALESDGSYTVSGFVRGDRGTEWATGLHEVGDWFILLTDPDNVFINMASESLTLERIYRGITNRAALDTGDDVEFAYRGVNLEPLSTVYARATRDGSGNLTGTFVRRSRLSSSWWSNGVVSPVGEYAEAYEIDVMNGSAVARTISVTAAAFNYSAADQTTDFGSPQSSITFRIYQLSEVVGRGYVREVTL